MPAWLVKDAAHEGRAVGQRNRHGRQRLAASREAPGGEPAQGFAQAGSGGSLRPSRRREELRVDRSRAAVSRAGRRHLAPEQALEQHGRLGGPAGAGEARRLVHLGRHQVLHLVGSLLGGTAERPRREASPSGSGSMGCGGRGGAPRAHFMRSASAALTAGLACSAPSTTIEAMVARASSGVTSLPMLASPRTRMSSIRPAARAASRSSRP